MARVNAGAIVAFTSFYALHEVFLFALKNVSTPEDGRQLGKEALHDILQTEVSLLPMVTRQEKVLYTRTFAALQDSSDVSHAISAHLAGCRILVSHDRHFVLPAILEWKRPEQLVASL